MHYKNTIRCCSEPSNFFICIHDMSPFSPNLMFFNTFIILVPLTVRPEALGTDDITVLILMKLLFSTLQMCR